MSLRLIHVSLLLCWSKPRPFYFSPVLVLSPLQLISLLNINTQCFSMCLQILLVDYS